MVHSVTIRHDYSHAQLYDQVSALNKEISRLQRYRSHISKRARYQELSNDIARLREVRDVYLQLEYHAKEEETTPSWPDQIAQRLNQPLKGAQG